MQPELALPARNATVLAGRLPEAWRRSLTCLALVWGLLLLVTGRDWLVMADQWWNVSTYNHIMIVPAIVGGLVWIRRFELARLEPAPWWPGLVALGGAMLLWFLGRVGEVNTFSQLGAVCALQGAVLALCGPRVTAALLFPLAYMFFLVPFGGELVPALQMITAGITIALTEWSGIPARIEGVFIDTPAGLFEVAEACSGVEFLVAMMALGILVAKTCFTGWGRRLLFLAACAVVPIVANGIRAWGTIYIAQSQGIAFAAGFDHIIYGWVFFAVVTIIVLGGAWRFFDRSPEDPGIDGAAIAEAPLYRRLDRFTARAPLVMAASAAIILFMAGWAFLASRLEAALPETVSLPSVAGWEMVDYAPELHWEPRAAGADHRLLGRYRDSSGRQVDVFLAMYAAQGEGREASAPGEGALPPDTLWRWKRSGEAIESGRRDELFALGRIRRTADTHYRQGNLLTGSATALKLATIRDRVLLRVAPTSMLVVSSVERPDSDPAAAIAAFRQSTGPLGPWIDRIAESR